MKGRPDLDFSTSVKAKEVTFGRVPEKKVRYYGEPDHEAEVEVERENIPEEPEEGVTYRDVEVSWSVAQRIVHPADVEEAWAAEFESGGSEGPEKRSEQ
jgi:hypothetical protein